MKVQPTAEQIELRAHQAWEQGRMRQAFKLLQQAALAGSRNCMLNLGYFLEGGLGGVLDRAEAMRWYRRAYRLGDAAAASNIAVMHAEDGKYRLAFAWYLRGATLGDGDAHVELALMLLNGRGVRHSLERANAHLSAALCSNSISPAARQEAAQIASQLAAGA